jgi:hypothetical protein
MPNLGFNTGDRISMRLVHLFELENGKITREIAYEMSRKYKGPPDIDAIPENAVVVEQPDGPHCGQWWPFDLSVRASWRAYGAMTGAY